MKIRISYPRQNRMAMIELPNFEFLPLFYLFPEELLRDECPSLAELPRSIHGIFTQDAWVEKLVSDYFLQAVCDLTAHFVWPVFGISTYMECFSGYDPLWRLAHATQIWEEAYEHMSGITAQTLACFPKREWPSMELDELQEIMLQIGMRGIEEHNLMPCIHAVRKHRCFEDYDQRGSNVKIDFYRKWHHTRTRFKTVSLDQLIERHNGDARGDAMEAVLGDFIDDPAAGFEETVCTRADTKSFYKTLKPRDLEILEMRVEGSTYQEIADKLGYKTHSAVLKRINKVSGQYLDWKDHASS